MAIVHRSTLSPTKLELLAEWLPGQPWYAGSGELELVANFRFDDPAGEVGLETLLVTAGGPVLQVPLTYRGAPLAGGEAYLVGTLQHSVLGKRWVYDACGDPVWVAALAATILTGGRQADIMLQTPEGLERRENPCVVRGSGRASTAPNVTRAEPRDDGPLTRLDADELELVVIRVLGERPDGAATLEGDWPGTSGALLAVANPKRG